MEYYHDLITEKSFQILQDLRKKYQFILIGGWATFLYTKGLKSKDIDIIVEYKELEKLKNDFSVFKNERLKKYEIKIEEIDIDIYLPFYSQLGLPIEEIKNYTQSQEGFIVPWPEILLILKIYVFDQRKNSAKGQKDLLDIFSLLKSNLINWRKYREIIKKYRLSHLNDDLKNLVSSVKPLAELNLNEQAIAKLKKKILPEIK
jgi:hypothetical protein